jgi:hypothetical protein
MNRAVVVAAGRQRAAQVQQRLRDRAEHHLRLAAMEELRRSHPGSTTEPYREDGGAFWRLVFVPLYRRLPWDVKTRAMHALRMTAAAPAWTPPARRPGEPWKPPSPSSGAQRDVAG